MNVIVILSDEHSYNAMGCCGHPYVRTPNLDRMAKNGIRFENCYTCGPLCVPARASILTGQYTNILGTWDNGTPYAGDSYDLFRHFKNNHVDCTYIGRLDLHDKGHFDGLKGDYYAMRKSPDIGGLFRQSRLPRPNARNRFDEGIFERKEEHPDTLYTRKAIDFIHEHKNASEPFVMFLGYAHPHFPFGYQRKFWDYYDPLIKDIPEIAKPPFPELNEPLKCLRNHFCGDYPDIELIRKCHVGYYSLVSEMDENIGSVLDAIEKDGLLDNTVVIYTSDHGEQLGHHGLWWKCCMYEDSAHIPLIFYGRGVSSGVRTSTTACSVDLFPTICEAVGIPIPETVQGKSLWVSVVSTDAPETRDYVFSEYHGHGMPVGMFMIKYRHYKYVYYAGTDEQLFDLEQDPEEKTDLLKKKVTDEISAIHQACRSRLWSVCDPDEVSERALGFQKKMAARYHLTEYTRESCQKALDIPAFFPETVPLRK